MKVVPINWQASEDTVNVAGVVDRAGSFALVSGCVQLTPSVPALFSSGDPPSTVVVWVLVALVNVSAPVPVRAPSVAVMSHPSGLVLVTVIAVVALVPVFFISEVGAS
jgi:hypothetical protein